jgi:hypothetical protein
MQKKMQRNELVHVIGKEKSPADLVRSDARTGSVSARFRTQEKSSVKEAVFRKFGKPFFGAF